MLTVFSIIFGAVVLLNLISLFVNQLIFSHELDNIAPYGKLVEVNGEKMHVYTMGDGDKTIVILPGFGNPLPSADFAPLMRALAKEYTVMSIEYFGIGFSEETKLPRTNENYTEEIRLALSAAGFSTPYILMPHSGSGIYTEYFATTYPEEVLAIIMLDTTSSAELTVNIPKFVYRYAKVKQAIGLARPLNSFIVSSVLKINKKNGYTQTEINDYTKFMSHYYNDTVTDQLAQLNQNIEEVRGMDFPVKIPVLKLVASETARGKQTGERYQNAHMERLGRNAEWRIIEGNHYLYHGYVEDICSAAKDFLKNL